MPPWRGLSFGERWLTDRRVVFGLASIPAAIAAVWAANKVRNDADLEPLTTREGSARARARNPNLRTSSRRSNCS